MIIRAAKDTDIDTLVTLLRSSFRDVAERFELTIENCPKNLAFCTIERIKNDLARGLIYYIFEKDEPGSYGKPEDEITYSIYCVFTDQRLSYYESFRFQYYYLIAHKLEF